MIISHKYKFIFIKTQKTAGTSIELYLAKLCGKSDICTPSFPELQPPLAKNYKGFHNPFLELLKMRGQGYKWLLPNTLKFNKYFHHIPANSVKSRVPKAIWNNYFKFCVERNPWDKTVSYYCMTNHLSNKNHTFDTYIKKRNFPHNFLLYTLRNGTILVDKIIRYENLNDDLENVFSMLGIPFKKPLRIFAKSHFRKNKTSYRNFYKDEQRKIIEHDFKKEIQFFGYKF